MRALDEAAAWIEGHRIEALQILDRGHYLDVPLQWLVQSLTGDLQVGLAQTKRGADYFHAFHRYQANFPWRSQAQWFLQQMQRWQQIRGEVDAAAVAAKVYRSDLYRDIFSTTHNLPNCDVKPEGKHAHPWLMPGTRGDIELGPDLFIDGAVFEC